MTTPLKEVFNTLKDKEPSDGDIEKMARETVLSPGDVRIWLEHLQIVSTNRKRRAATRRSRQMQPRMYVCVCVCVWRQMRSNAGLDVTHVTTGIITTVLV